MTFHEPSNPLARSSNRLAVFLHPWGRAGGNSSDPVLLSLVTTFIERDWHIILYNSRGVGHSGGSVSFTAIAESQDLRDVVQYALKEIEQVTEILLLGYSFGTLPVTMHPLRLPFSPHISPDLTIRHVLLSYPLSVLWFLTFFHSGTYANALKQLLGDPGSDVLVIHGDADQFTKYSKYEAWVEELKRIKDVQFDASDPCSPSPKEIDSTTSGHLRTPSSSSIGSVAQSITSSGSGTIRNARSSGGGRLTVYTVKGGDHLWRKPEHRKELRTVLAKWLDSRYAPLTPRSTVARTGSVSRKTTIENFNGSSETDV
ncbi:Alpha/Beta hydrolase protein [Cantharellus anzutake]|uniref:Alpha/Beta hydrolase protein n=1 Tax=Cantharellus anzutake TaxID=1750568 RepID=UPI00190849AE|nr:Alpha/Beta hydrolase protein [Cantharellus anzutake]KAF8339543.1 Alpha/Beta hydrolase protein [Cantharellus anzutake]